MGTNRKYFYAKSATIAYHTDGGTDIDVGHLQNVEIRVESDHVELRDAGTNKRAAVGQHNIRVPVKAEIKSIDADLLGDILSPSGSNYTAGTGTLSTIEDTAIPALFDVIATVDSDAGKTLTVTVRNVAFPNLPILIGTMGQWVSWNIEGVGNDMTFVEEA